MRFHKHSAACPKRQYTCDFCNFGSTYDAPCPYNCRPEPIERHNLEEHEKECPLANSMVDCEYKAEGCKFRTLRKDMQLHLKENMVEHLALVADSRQIDDQCQANGGIGLNYQEIQMTALGKKQDKLEGRVEQAERTLRDVDYKVHVQNSKVPQQMKKLEEQCAKLEQKHEDVRNTASYQSIIASQKTVQVKEELGAAVAKQGCEMAQLGQQLGQQLEESTAVQRQQVAELRQELQESSEGVEQQITELKREDKTVRERMAQDKEEVMATVAQEKQALKDEMIATLTREIRDLKDTLDAVSRENQDRIAKLTNDLHQANEMLQLQDRKMLQLQKEHNQDLSLIRRSMITSVKIPCEQTMINFEDRKLSNTPWYSEPFTTPSLDYKFCLVVYANGSGPSEGTHVSIYAHLMEGSASETVWPAGGEVMVTLVNQLGDRGNNTVNIPLSSEVLNPPERRTPGIDLVSHRKLRSRTADIAYLQNDQLRLRITEFRAPNPVGASRQGGWFWS